MPLRIAVVTQAYHPAIGGISVHVDATARALRRRGHEVTIVTARYDNRTEHEPGVLRIGRNLAVRYNGAEVNVTVGWGLKRAFERILGERRFDLIHVHCPLSPVLPLIALRAARQPIVGTFHSTVRSDLPFRVFRRRLLPYYRKIDHAIAVSETARSFVGRHFPGPIEIVPNGVDLDRFHPGLEPIPRFADGVPNIVFVGRLDPRKGLQELVRACTRLAAERLRFRLIVVGDGALRRPIERMARRSLGERVLFEGRAGHESLPRYYASADVFCSPAREGESFGMVLLEAMACGVPIVAGDLPGYRSVLTDGVEGFTARPRDADALAAALRRLLLDRDLRAHMGACGAETARRYGWPRVVARLEAIYGSLASHSAARERRDRAPGGVLESVGA